MNRNLDYLSVPRPRKVKHVKFFTAGVLSHLEEKINNFIDEHPEYKILGLRLMQDNHTDFIATLTYLEDAKGGVVYTGEEDDSWED